MSSTVAPRSPRQCRRQAAPRRPRSARLGPAQGWPALSRPRIGPRGPRRAPPWRWLGPSTLARSSAVGGAASGRWRHVNRASASQRSSVLAGPTTQPLRNPGLLHRRQHFDAVVQLLIAATMSEIGFQTEAPLATAPTAAHEWHWHAVDHLVHARATHVRLDCLPDPLAQAGQHAIQLTRSSIRMRFGSPGVGSSCASAW